MYPSLSEYRQAFELSTETLKDLAHLTPLRKPDGELFFSSGNFAAVFRMQNRQTGQPVALRCFLRAVPGRKERLTQIARYLAQHPSPYWVPVQYHTAEIWVDTRFGGAAEFDVLAMPWIEGPTLAAYVAACCRAENKEALGKLAQRFDAFAHWLIHQPVAHGDLKPDNILVEPNGRLVLVDYDGFYVPGLDELPALETGTSPYRHPQRTPAHYNRHLDDFGLLALSLELHALSIAPQLYREADSLLLRPDTLERPFESLLWQQLRELKYPEVSIRAGLLEYALHSPIGPIDALKALVAPPKPARPEPLIPYLKGRQWGFANQSQQLIIAPDYEDAGPFVDGMAAVKKGGKYGYINQQGKAVAPFQFEEALEFADGLGLVRGKGRWGFINREGQLVIPCDYESAGRFSGGLAPVRKEGRYGFIDPNGELVIPCQFDSVRSFSEALAPVKRGARWGFINPQGGEVIGCQFDSVMAYSGGRAMVERAGQYGFVDSTGQLVITYQFEMASSFSEGLAAVKKEGRFGFIDAQGNLVIPFDRDGIQVAFPFSEGLALVEKEEVCGFINHRGQLVIPFLFEAAGNFSEGLAMVRQGGKWGFVNQQGQLVIPCQFDHAYHFRQGLALVRQNGRRFYIDRLGTAYVA